MKTTITLFICLGCTLLKAQTNQQDLLQNILADVLTDSSFSHDLCTINGIPTQLSYSYKSYNNQPLVIDRSRVTKEYTKEDGQAPITINLFRLQQKSSADLARLELLFPDGTKARMRAHRYARKGGRWFLTFYKLSGRNLESGSKTLILKGEI
jgi:hypothetical protein